MKWTLTVAALGIAACAGTPAALADGQLRGEISIPLDVDSQSP